MKCKREDCEVELTGRKQYCSDKCRKAQSRTPKSDTQVGQRDERTYRDGPPPSPAPNPRSLSPSILVGLPPGVVKPTGQPTKYTASLTAWELNEIMPRVDWQSSVEYAEIIYRLLTTDVDTLESEGQWVPSWKAA